jgi:predicted transcriptional regulator
VIVEENVPAKVIIRNTVTMAKMSFNDNTDINIISQFILADEIIVEILAEKLDINKSRIMSTMKKVAKRGFLKNVSETYQLLD